MSSVLVADIGGTSSRWALLQGDAGPGEGWSLPGFNAAVGDPAVFRRAIVERFADRPEMLAATQLHVYGAGCGSALRQERMAAVLRGLWPLAGIDVQSDLLGAARALHGREAGCILILGTGMNAGWYDGHLVHTPMPSMGYILGDEGSGAHIGKALLRAALLGDLHPELMATVFPEGITMDEVSTHVYRGDSPQAWLAALAGKLANVAEHPQARELVSGCFGDLATLLVRFFPAERSARIKASGSIAAGHQAALKQALATRSIHLTDVEASPMMGLLRYHQHGLL
jgi:N-acetylglucosamine kinase-like BadF-type ATPase